jgi:hypothetical protein
MMSADSAEQAGLAAPSAVPPPPPAAQENLGWLRGFLEIWTGQGRTLKANTGQWRKIASAGLLMWVIAHAVSLYMYSQSDGIRADNLAMMKTSGMNLDEDTKKNNPQTGAQSFEFSATAALQSGLVKALQSWLPLTLLFWGSFALIGGGLTFGATAGGTGYGMIISAAGMLITTALQTAAGSLRYAPGAGIFTSPGDHPWLFGFLTNISVFSMWHYAVLGLSLAYVARYRPKVGLAVGAFCYATMLVFMGIFSWLGQLMAQ